MAIYFQVISTFLISYICINMGIINAWPSSTVLLFQSANTTLHRPMEDIEISLLGSLPAVGCLLGNPIAGFILDKLGRKRSSILASMMFVVSWSIVAATSQVEVVLVAVFIGGLGSAVFLIIMVFISEICEVSIRGTLTAVPIQFYSIGFLISYSMGGYLDYYGSVYAYLSMAVAGVLVVTMMKETPISLMTKGKEVEEVAKSIAFYRRQRTTSNEVLREVVNLRRILGLNEGRDILLLTAKETCLEPEFQAKKISRWQYFKNSASTQREFLVVMVLETALVLQGMSVVLVYATPFFAQAVASDVMAASDSSILLGVVALFSGFIVSFLTDVVGRRPLIIFASFVTGLCCIALGTLLSKDWGPNWMVPLFIYFYTVFYTIGAGTVPTVVLSEVFMPEVKSVLAMLAVEWAWVCNFIILFVFHPLVSAVGLPPLFFFFAAMCFATAVFCHYQLPETKGLSLDAIQEVFRKK